MRLGADGGVLSKDSIALAKLGNTSAVSSDSFCNELSLECEHRPRSSSLTVSEEVLSTSAESDVFAVCEGDFSTAPAPKSLHTFSCSAAGTTGALLTCSDTGGCCFDSSSCSGWLLEPVLLCICCCSRLCNRDNT